jgi:hypothetical protein
MAVRQSCPVDSHQQGQGGHHDQLKCEPPGGGERSLEHYLMTGKSNLGAREAIGIGSSAQCRSVVIRGGQLGRLLLQCQASGSTSSDCAS